MFNEKFFMNRMEENVCYNLIFPFHIHLDKVKGTDYFNPNYPDSYHEHTFASVLSLAYREPEAFYLTDEDKTLLIRYHKCECFGLILDWINHGIKDDYTKGFKRIYQLKKGSVEDMIHRCYS